MNNHQTLTRMHLKSWIFGTTLSLMILACSPMDQATSAEAIESSSQPLIVTQNPVRLKISPTGINGTNVTLVDAASSGYSRILFTVMKATETLPLEMYDGLTTADLSRSRIVLSPSRWDHFLTTLNSAGGIVSIGVSYDPYAQTVYKGVAKFCYQGICIEPGSYPKDRSFDMRLLGTSCLGANKTVVGKMSDEAGDGALLCLIPWG